MEYDKLVRDRIPEIIAENGGSCQTRTLDETEYRQYLVRKLHEETGEYEREPDIMELADIMEVVYALAAADGHSREALDAARIKKAEERGGFEKRILLTRTEK